MHCRLFHKTKNGSCIHYISNSDDIGLCKQSTQFLCLEDLKTGLPKMSHSSRIDFVHCRRKYYLRKIQGLRVKKSMLPEPVKMGIIWDEFLQYRYGGRNFKSRFWELVDEYDLSDESVAKKYSLIRAFINIGIKIDLDGFIGCQYEFNFIDGDVVVTGFIDRAYDNCFIESKLSARPDFYHIIHNITSQLSTYFLSNDQYEHCVVEAVRVPALRTRYGKYSEEDYESYMHRIYQDIISRPSHYFLGFNRDEKTYGKRFWRNEFPLEQIHADYRQITKDIRRAIDDNAFYQNFMACHVPAPCAYLPICETGVMSELIYEQKPKGKGGDKK
jgi:hypothetical protein